MGIVGEFLLHRWYVFVIAILYWIVMKYLGKGTRFAREASQVSATLQILFLLVYTGSALWLLASGTAASQAFIYAGGQYWRCRVSFTAVFVDLVSFMYC